MTYQEFRNQKNGLYIDKDGQYGAQCWDLAQAYVTECLGLPSWVLSGCGVAKNLLVQPKRSDLETYFYEVSIYEMIPGDLCIWDNSGAGHIAIYDHWDEAGCCNYFFSQNPGPSVVQRCEGIGTLHAFRLRKKEEPTPKPEITPNVERDEYKNQIEVKVEKLRVRTTPSLNGEILGTAKEGFYNYYEIVDAEGYNWYRIADNQWVAYNEEWFNVYPAKPKEEFIKLKVLDKKDGYVLVDLGQIWIKE